jgi:hypothetical protein
MKESDLSLFESSFVSKSKNNSPETSFYNYQENQKKPSLQMKQPFFNKLGGIPFERKFVSKKHLTVQIS